jgi:hypothetical protein
LPEKPSLVSNGSKHHTAYQQRGELKRDFGVRTGDSGLSKVFAFQFRPPSPPAEPFTMIGVRLSTAP